MRCLTTNVDPSKCWETLKKQRFSWRMSRREILKKQDPEDLRSWRKVRHPEDISRWRISWRVVFVRLFVFSWVLGKHRTVGGVEENEFRSSMNFSIRNPKEKPGEISCSRSSVLGCLRPCSSEHWGNCLQLRSQETASAVFLKKE